jgi:hypothetical protein
MRHGCTDCRRLAIRQRHDRLLPGYRQMAHETDANVPLRQSAGFKPAQAHGHQEHPVSTEGQLHFASRLGSLGQGPGGPAEVASVVVTMPARVSAGRHHGGRGRLRPRESAAAPGCRQVRDAGPGPVRGGACSPGTARTCGQAGTSA